MRKGPKPIGALGFIRNVTIQEYSKTENVWYTPAKQQINVYRFNGVLTFGGPRFEPWKYTATDTIEIANSQRVGIIDLPMRICVMTCDNSKMIRIAESDYQRILSKFAGEE